MKRGDWIIAQLLYRKSDEEVRNERNVKDMENAWTSQATLCTKSQVVETCRMCEPICFLIKGGNC